MGKNSHPLVRQIMATFSLLSILLLAIPAISEPTKRLNTQREQAWLSPIARSFVDRPFGVKSCHSDKTHQGVDIVTKKEAGVVAPTEGLVIVAAQSDRFFPGLNDLIVVDHGDDTLSVFANLGKQLVQTGDWVKRGQRIAMTQKTTRQTNQTFTHVELRYHGKAIDPFQRLPYVFFDMQLPPPENWAEKNAPE